MIAPIAAMTDVPLRASHQTGHPTHSGADYPADQQADHDLRPVRTADVLHLAAAGVIEDCALARALELAGCAPTARGWRIAVDRLLLGLGIGLLAAGIICLVAYNWSSLPRWGRLALAQSVLLLVLALGWRLGLGSSRGKAVLTLAIALIGPLLALYGQTYQTGAELAGLFLTWAALALPWILAARLASGWLLWLAIVETGLLLHLTALELWGVLWLGRAPTWTWVCLLNLLALVGWERLSVRLDWLHGRLGPRLLATALLAPLTALTCLFLWPPRAPGLALAPFAWLLVLAAGFVAYRMRRVDLVMLALGWLTVTIVLLAGLARLLGPWSTAPAGWLLGAASTPRSQCRPSADAATSKAAPLPRAAR